MAAITYMIPSGIKIFDIISVNMLIIHFNYFIHKLADGLMYLPMGLLNYIMYNNM